MNYKNFNELFFDKSPIEITIDIYIGKAYCEQKVEFIILANHAGRNRWLDLTVNGKTQANRRQKRNA